MLLVLMGCRAAMGNRGKRLPADRSKGYRLTQSVPPYIIDTHGQARYLAVSALCTEDCSRTCEFRDLGVKQSQGRV